jgi:hypothetical protein
MDNIQDCGNLLIYHCQKLVELLQHFLNSKYEQLGSLNLATLHQIGRIIRVVCYILSVQTSWSHADFTTKQTSLCH